MADADSILAALVEWFEAQHNATCTVYAVERFAPHDQWCLNGEFDLRALAEHIAGKAK